MVVIVIKTVGIENEQSCQGDNGMRVASNLRSPLFRKIIYRGEKSCDIDFLIFVEAELSTSSNMSTRDLSFTGIEYHAAFVRLVVRIL